MKDISFARALAYDMIGGGSLRIYKPEIQEKVLEIIGISPERAETKFGYLLVALDMGAPPHVENLPFEFMLKKRIVHNLEAIEM